MQSEDFKNWLIRNGGGGAGALVVLLILVFLVGGDISSRADRIRSQKRDLEARLQSLNSLITLRAGADRAARLLPKLQEALPSKDQLIGFSKYIDTLARQNKLSAVFLFESETSGTDSVPGINSFSLTLGGTYNDYVKFLKSLEESNYFVNFSSMDISEKENKFEILIKGKVFSQ